MMIPGYDDYQERVQRGLLAYTCMGLIQKIDSLQQEIDAAVSETAYFRDKLTEILEMPWESGVCPDDANIIEEVRKRIKTIKYKYDTEHEPIGPVELNGIKYVPTEYIKRLEAKYLQSQAARLFYATHNTGAQWGQVGELFREPYEKSARECLEHIKRGDA